ncbi:restriction endonuclease subunit S [Bacteroides fragilis]
MVLPNSLSSYYEKIIATGEVKCIDEEIPFEIPKGWEWERWGNISQSIQYGYNAPALEKGVIRMVRISDIQDNKVLWNTVPFCMIEEKDIETYLLEVNDILFARTGGTVGKSFLVEEVPTKSIYAGYLIRTRYSSLLCPHYMKAFMESQLYWEQLKNGTIATAQPNCNGKTLAKMLLPIPPINEQKRIVERLRRISPFIERYSKSQDALNLMNMQIREQFKKSVLQEAIQGKLVPQIAEEGTAQELLEQIKLEKQKLVKEGELKKSSLSDSIIYKGDDNKYWEKKGKTEKDITDEIPFEIPDSWAWVRLSSISDIIGGYAFQSSSLKEEHGKRVIRISDINEKGFVNTKIVRYNGSPISDIYKLQRFDILMAMTGGTVGKSLFVRELPEDELLLNQRVARIRNLWISVDYLNFVIIAPHIKEFISKQKNSTNDNISMADISNFLIPLPSIKEQLRIVEKLYNLASIMRG